MAKLSKHNSKAKAHIDIDGQLEALYDQTMADVYDILMEAYDEVGVKVKEALEQSENLDEYDVELEEDDLDYLDDDE